MNTTKVYYLAFDRKAKKVVQFEQKVQAENSGFFWREVHANSYALAKGIFLDLYEQSNHETE